MINQSIIISSIRTPIGGLNTDITGAPRSSPSDLGAYNAIDFEN